MERTDEDNSAPHEVMQLEPIVFGASNIDNNTAKAKVKTKDELDKEP